MHRACLLRGARGVRPDAPEKGAEPWTAARATRAGCQCGSSGWWGGVSRPEPCAGTSSASPVAACPLAVTSAGFNRTSLGALASTGSESDSGELLPPGSVRLADDLPPQPRRAAKAKPHQPVRAGRCANMQRTILEPRTAARGKASGHGRGATNNNANAAILRRTASDASAAPLVAHSTAVPSGAVTRGGGRGRILVLTLAELAEEAREGGSREMAGGALVASVSPWTHQSAIDRPNDRRPN